MTIAQFTYPHKASRDPQSYWQVDGPQEFLWKGHYCVMLPEYEYDESVPEDDPEHFIAYAIPLNLSINGVHFNELDLLDDGECQRWLDLTSAELNHEAIGTAPFTEDFLEMLGLILERHLENLKETV